MGKKAYFLVMMRARAVAMKEFWRKFRKNKAAVAGLIFLIFIALLAILSPIIIPYDPGSLGVASSFVAPSLAHLMGSDNLGRDSFSRVLFGAKFSLMIGLLAAATSFTIGLFVGTISGYFGGRIDDILMRITEFFMVIPRFFLALILVANFGSNLWFVILVLGITLWTRTARILRSQILSLKETTFVEAAKAIGEHHRSIMFREILPNAMPSVIVDISLQVGNAIMLESSLSFLGLGNVSLPSWGLLLNLSQPFIRTAWWLALFPGLLIFLTVLSTNLVGDGLSDALSPRVKALQ